MERFGVSIARQSVQCTDCQGTIEKHDRLWFDNARKTPKGKGVMICDVCKAKLEASGEVPGGITLPSPAGVVTANIDLEPIVKRLAKIEEVLCNLGTDMLELTKQVNENNQRLRYERHASQPSIKTNIREPYFTPDEIPF